MGSGERLVQSCFVIHTLFFFLPYSSCMAAMATAAVRSVYGLLLSTLCMLERERIRRGGEMSAFTCELRTGYFLFRYMAMGIIWAG